MPSVARPGHRNRAVCLRMLLTSICWPGAASILMEEAGCGAVSPRDELPMAQRLKEGLQKELWVKHVKSSVVRAETEVAFVRAEVEAETEVEGPQQQQKAIIWKVDVGGIVTVSSRDFNLRVLIGFGFGSDVLKFALLLVPQDGKGPSYSLYGDLWKEFSFQLRLGLKPEDGGLETETKFSWKDGWKDGWKDEAFQRSLEKAITEKGSFPLFRFRRSGKEYGAALPAVHGNATQGKGKEEIKADVYNLEGRSLRAMRFSPADTMIVSSKLEILFSEYDGAHGAICPENDGGENSGRCRVKELKEDAYEWFSRE